MNHMIVTRKLLKLLIYNFLLLLPFFLSIRSVLAQDTSLVTNTSISADKDRYRFLFLVGFHGGFGSYKNLSMQKGDPTSLMKSGSDACFFGGEAGFRIYLLGVTSHYEILSSPIATSVDREHYVHGAQRIRYGIRTFLEVPLKTLHFIPEGGYVFVREEADVYDLYGKKPDLYKERYKDRDYSYGLSVQLKLIPIRKVDFWLHGRYVHDNLDIKIDNYWIMIHALVADIDQSGGDEKTPRVESAHINLGVEWKNKTDGRSEWFLVLELGLSAGLF